MDFSVITKCVNHIALENSYTPHFWEGYRAYVNGGRYYKYDKGGHTSTAWGGIEPFDYLTEQQKREWHSGIKYGIKERKECRGLKR